MLGLLYQSETLWFVNAVHAFVIIWFYMKINSNFLGQSVVLGHGCGLVWFYFSLWFEKVLISSRLHKITVTSPPFKKPHFWDTVSSWPHCTLPSVCATKSSELHNETIVYCLVKTGSFDNTGEKNALMSLIGRWCQFGGFRSHSQSGWHTSMQCVAGWFKICPWFGLYSLVRMLFTLAGSV